VILAKFRGTEIAAKRYNRDLRSDYYQKMFTREMTMAARLWHPNLVQFIGASVDGNPIILTELMTTTLRAELEKGPIRRQQITSISRDVTRALNYLHQMQPHPIIHRDISSGS
jgi:serine/threonine protein kinase